MTRVAGHAPVFDISVFPEDVKGVFPEGGPPGGRQDWLVALFALLIPEREAHVVWLAVPPDEEADGIEAGHRPNAKAHPEVSPAVAVDASDGGLSTMVGAGQVLGGRRPKPVKLLFVEVARDAEPIVALLPGKGDQEKE